MSPEHDFSLHAVGPFHGSIDVWEARSALSQLGTITKEDRINSDLKTTHGRLVQGLPLPQIEGIEHRFVEMQGIRLHIAEAGQGEPLFLLHGWPQHWYMWRHLIPQLAAHYRVLCPDLRGFGWSDAPKSS